MDKKTDPGGHVSFLQQWMIITLQDKIMEDPGRFAALNWLKNELIPKLERILETIETRSVTRSYDEIKEGFGCCILDLLFIAAVCHVDAREAIEIAMKKVIEFTKGGEQG